MENTNVETLERKDRFFDIKGVTTDMPLNKKTIISIVASVIVFFICYMLPVNSYGENTSKALGMLFGMITFSTFWGYSIAVPALVCPVVGFLLKLWDYPTIGSALGSSAMYMMVGMMIVALGIEFTPLGQRIAYFFLKKFGQKPVRLVVVFGLVTAVISWFVDDLAVTIMMSGIAAAMLTAMGEKPGESKIGRCLMLLITAMALMGGSVLICGSPSGNGRAIGFLESTTNGAYSITFAQWAAFGVPSFLIMAVPACLIYVKSAKLKDSDCQTLPESYYDEKLKALGPIGGSEIRWLLIVLTMVVLLMCGVLATPVAALLFAAVSVLPVIGVVKPQEAIKKIPWQNVLALCTFPLLGTLFTSTGLGDLVTDIMMPLVGGMSPMLFCFFACLISGLCVNLFVNANIAVCAMCVTIFTTVSVALGYNPTVMMYPTMCVITMFFAIGTNTFVLMNKGYGYWDMKDPIIPGFAVVILFSVVYSVVTVLMAKLIGIPLYI